MVVFTYKLFFLFLEATLLLSSKHVIHGIMEVVVGGRCQTPDCWTIYLGVVSILGFYNNSETWYVGILLIFGSTEVKNEILHLQELSKKNVDIPVLLLIWMCVGVECRHVVQVQKMYSRDEESSSRNHIGLYSYTLSFSQKEKVRMLPYLCSILGLRNSGLELLYSYSADFCVTGPHIRDLFYNCGCFRKQ